MPYGISWIHEHYTYLPSIGISTMIGWGIPRLFYNLKIRKIILFTSGIALITLFAVLSYQRCSYWENSLKLFSHALQNYQDDYLAYNSRGAAYFTLGKYQSALDVSMRPFVSP
jgi:tetratricopeptide (TPR) repeat protein